MTKNVNLPALWRDNPDAAPAIVREHELFKAGVLDAVALTHLKGDIKGMDDNEKAAHVMHLFSVCKEMGIPPSKPGGLYMIFRYDKRQGRPVPTIQVGRDQFRAWKLGHPLYAGEEQTKFIKDKDGNVVAAKATVYRWLTCQGAIVTDKDGAPMKQEFSFVAEWDAFAGNSPLWSKHPALMLSKCAEVGVTRMAFADVIGAVYAQEEMDQMDMPTTMGPKLPPKREPEPTKVEAAVAKVEAKEELPPAEEKVLPEQPVSEPPVNPLDCGTCPDEVKTECPADELKQLFNALPNGTTFIDKNKKVVKVTSFNKEKAVYEIEYEEDGRTKIGTRHVYDVVEVVKRSDCIAEEKTTTAQEAEVEATKGDTYPEGTKLKVKGIRKILKVVEIDTDEGTYLMVDREGNEEIVPISAEMQPYVPKPKATTTEDKPKEEDTNPVTRAREVASDKPREAAMSFSMKVPQLKVTTPEPEPEEVKAIPTQTFSAGIPVRPIRCNDCEAEGETNVGFICNEIPNNSERFEAICEKCGSSMKLKYRTTNGG